MVKKRVESCSEDSPASKLSFVSLSILIQRCTCRRQ